MAGKRAARLRTIQDISTYLARLINRLDRGEIEEAKASKLGYLCNILKSTLEAGDIEKRLEELEQLIREETKNGVETPFGLAGGMAGD